MYKTFGFAPIDENNSKLENFINQRIEKNVKRLALQCFQPLTCLFRPIISSIKIPITQEL